MKNQLLACICFIAGAGTVLATPPEETLNSRGRLLYENHCTRCHETSVHARIPGRITTLDELNQWVEKWATLQNLGWQQDDIHDVAEYLNHEYYHLKK